MPEDKKRLPLILFFSAVALYLISRGEARRIPRELINREVQAGFSDQLEVYTSILLADEYNVVVERDVRETGTIPEIYSVIIDRLIRTELQRNITVSYSDTIATVTSINIGDTYSVAIDRYLQSIAQLQDQYDIGVERRIVARLDRSVAAVYGEQMEVKTTIYFQDSYNVIVERGLYSRGVMGESYTIDTRRTIVGHIDRSITSVFNDSIEIISAVFIPESYDAIIERSIQSSTKLQDQYNAQVARSVFGVISRSMSMLYSDWVSIEGVVKLQDQYGVGVSRGIVGRGEVQVQDSYSVVVDSIVRSLFDRRVTILYSDEISQLGVVLQDEVYNVIVDRIVMGYTTTSIADQYDIVASSSVSGVLSRSVVALYSDQISIAGSLSIQDSYSIIVTRSIGFKTTASLSDTYTVQVDRSVQARNVPLDRSVSIVFSDVLGLEGSVGLQDQYNVQVARSIQENVVLIDRSVTVQYQDSLQVATSSLNVSDNTTITTSLTV